MLLFLSYLMMSYYYFGGWWNSSVGTLLIIGFSYLIWGKEFLRIIGLHIDSKTFLKTIILTAIILCGATFLMKIIAERHHFVIRFSNWQNYYHDIFYIINEEIVLGAIVLSTMINRFKIKPIISSILLAVIFSTIHFIFYKWIFLERGTISVITLINLFLIGIVRNNLIIRTGHIGYSWALHFGWMAIMFGSSHINTIDSNIRLSEPEKFNLYLGSVEMLIVCLILVTISLFHWKKSEAETTKQI